MQQMIVENNYMYLLKQVIQPNNLLLKNLLMHFLASTVNTNIYRHSLRPQQLVVGRNNVIANNFTCGLEKLNLVLNGTRKKN